MFNISNLANVDISKERIAKEGAGKIFIELLDAQQKDISAAISAQHEELSKIFDEKLSNLKPSRPQATPTIKKLFQRYMEEGDFEKAMKLADNFDGLEV